jgi:large subunit ribosomal protein L23
MGVFLGRSRSWKKAIVTLEPGERIEFFEGASI